MSELKLYLLGAPRLEYEGKPVQIKRRKALALAAYLALNSQPQSRESIINLLWPELDHEHGRATLRSTLPSLTRTVPFDWIKLDGMTLALKREHLWIDVQAFLEQLGRNRIHSHPEDVLCDECADSLQAAANLYHGDFLDGFHLPDSSAYEHWQREQREWLQRELGSALRRLALYAAETTRIETAMTYTRRWLSLDLLHEPAHRLLMQLYVTNGQRAEALRQYQQCAELLNAELATPPEEETTNLYEAILSNTQPNLAAVTARRRGVNTVLPPLPALVVGRDAVMLELKQRLGVSDGVMRPITVIQGWPGVGKSTLVARLAHDPEITRQFSDGILWASLGETPNLINELTTWASALGIRNIDPAQKLEDVSTQLRAMLRNKRMLLVVDDVWQTAHAAPFRIGGEACALVMTSRINETATALAPTAYDIYRLPVLDETAALELLGKLTPETVANHPLDSLELVRDLEGLPLAIHVAGRLLHSEARLGWGISELLADLRTGARLLQAEAPSDMVGIGRETTPTIAALLKRSTDALNAEARACFALLGLFVPKPATFDLTAMAAAWNMPDARTMARLLVNRGLLEPISGGRFQMHALLVLHARALLDDVVQ